MQAQLVRVDYLRERGLLRARRRRRSIIMKRFSFAIFLAFTSFAVAVQGQDESFRNAFGERFTGNQPAPPLPLHHAGADSIHRWNEIAIDASGLDHAPVPPGDPRVFGEQLGPGRASRAMAIVHIAIFDTINAVDRRYHSFTGVHATHYPLSLIAAVSQSAHDTLVALYPSQTAAFQRAARRRPGGGSTTTTKEERH
jgi:hypothetical protein